MLLNCHLAAFVQSIKILKMQPNNNLVTLACVIALVYYTGLATYNIGKTLASWPQLDVSSSSYQLF